MSNRHRLSQVRASMYDLASDLHGIAMDVESRNARTLIERARKLLQAAHHEVDAAMLQPLDAAVTPTVGKAGMRAAGSLQ